MWKPTQLLYYVKSSNTTGKIHLSDYNFIRVLVTFPHHNPLQLSRLSAL